MATPQDDDLSEEEEEEDWSAPLDDPNDEFGQAQAVAQMIKTRTNGHTESREITYPGGKAESSTEIVPNAKSEPTNKSGLVSRMELNDTKAGMEGLDKERINKIIYEASKGSRYYENEMKKEEQVTARIEEHTNRLALITPEQIQIGIQQADVILHSLDVSRDLSRTIVHVDMDAFYAAVEMRDNPALRNVPMAVGGNSMLTTSNYLARRFGVRAAMPGFIGRKLCPDLVIVPNHSDKYTAASKQIRAVMADYDPNFCPMSLDEAYLDMTEHLQKRASFGDEERSFQVMLGPEEICKCDEKAREAHTKDKVCGAEDSSGCTGQDPGVESEENKCTERTQNKAKDLCPLCGRPLDISHGKVETFGVCAEEAVREMRARIHWETKLTASAGIAPNTMLAKVCSDQNKPNGQYYMPATRDTVLHFIKNLDIRKVSGIGKVAASMLYSLGVNTCADLYTKRGALYHLYSETSLQYFLRISLGIGSTRVKRDGERKSMSTERTFSEIHDPKELYEKCRELSISLAEDMNDEKLVGKTVGIKLKTVNFKLMTRAQTMRNPTADAEQIYGVAREILRTEIMACQPEPLRLRLMGVRISNLMAKDAVIDQKQRTITSLLSKIMVKPVSHDTPSEDQPASITATQSETIPTEAKLSADKMEDCSNQETDTSKGSIVWLRSGRAAKRETTYVCPICCKDIEAPNLEHFNKHIDECLVSAETPQAVSQEEKTPDVPAVHTEEGDGAVIKADGQADDIQKNTEEGDVDIEADDTRGNVGIEPPSGPIAQSEGAQQLSEVVESSDTETSTEHFDEPPKEPHHTCEELTTEDEASDVAEQEIVNPESSHCRTTDPVADIKLEHKCNGGITEEADDNKDSNTVNSDAIQPPNKLVCPVCGKLQDSADLAVFNRHVDECLNQGLLGEGISVLTATKVPKFVKDNGGRSKKKVERPKSTSRQKRPAISAIQNTTKGHLSSAVSGPGENSENQEDVCLMCPVCDLSQEWTSMDVFSRHVDACLNRAAIKEMLHSDSNPLSKRQPSSPPEEPASKRKKTLARGIQRIDSFFKH